MFACPLCPLVSQFLSGKLLCGRKRSTTSRNTAERRAPPAVHFLLFETLSEVRKLTTFYLAKNDHRWVTFISLKTMSVHFLSFSIFSNKQPRQGRSRRCTEFVRGSTSAFGADFARRAPLCCVSNVHDCAPFFSRREIHVIPLGSFLHDVGSSDLLLSTNFGCSISGGLSFSRPAGACSR